MDEHDVVEAGTDLLFGDPKSVLKKIGLSILDKKQFEAIFVSAGKTVAEYEKDNTEQNDIRKILFCEETMRLLANEIRKSNSFDWLNDLDRCVNDLLSLSELDSINKARCKVSAKYCYAAHESRLHQNDRCKRFTLCLVLTVRFRSLAPWGKLFQLFI